MSIVSIGVRVVELVLKIGLIPTVAVPVCFVMLLPMGMRECVVMRERGVVEAAVVGRQVLAVESVTTERSLFVVLRSHLD